MAAPGFWLVETRGLQILYMVVSGFLAGLFVPIWIFPQWLETVAQGKQIDDVGGMVGDRLPRTLGERAARPGLVHLAQCRFELGTSR